jgi:hypothetical protein
MTGVTARTSMGVPNPRQTEPFEEIGPQPPCSGKVIQWWPALLCLRVNVHGRLFSVPLAHIPVHNQPAATLRS